MEHKLCTLNLYLLGMEGGENQFVVQSATAPSVV